MSWVGKIQKLIGTDVPYYVRNKNVGTLLQSAALVFDQHVETMLQGLRLTQPLRCDASALPVLSRDRGIRIYDTEPVASKRYRLSQWRQLRRQFGTHHGELRNVAPYFLPALPLMRIVHQNGEAPLQPGDPDRATWHTLTAAGTYQVVKRNPSNWNWDDQYQRWSRWWVIIYRDVAMALDAVAEWDDGSEWDDGTLWDGGPSTEQIADLVAAFKEAQAPHSKLAGVIVSNDATAFDPTAVAVYSPDGWTSLPVGNWGQTIDAASGLPTRPPYASLVYDAGYVSAWTDPTEPRWWRAVVAEYTPTTLYIAGEWCFADEELTDEAGDGEEVLVVRDLSGLGLDAPADGTGALLDVDAFGAGLAGLVFDGAATAYLLDQLTGTLTNCTLMAVVLPASVAGTQVLVGATDTARLSAVEGGDVSLHDGTGLRTGPVATTFAQLLTVVLDSAAGEARFYRDGVLLVTEVYDGTWSWSEARLGAAGGAVAASFFDGVLGLLMVLSEALA